MKTVCAVRKVKQNLFKSVAPIFLVANETIPVNSTILSDIISGLEIFGTQFSTILKAAGIVAIIWIIIQVISFILEIKKSKDIKQIKESLKVLDEKINSLSAKKSS